MSGLIVLRNWFKQNLVRFCYRCAYFYFIYRF
nr:MAG TPA: hypothetical protein [Caudoviricetes sp.]